MTDHERGRGGMPPRPTDDERFEADVAALFAEMLALLKAKRASYGATNLLEYGHLGIVVRASDKVRRLGNMYRAGTDANPDGDTAEDAYKDLLGYAVLGLLHLRDGGR